MTTYISVDKFTLEDRLDNPIRVYYSENKIVKCSDVEILGPSRIKYGTEPNSYSNSRVWVETESEVTTDSQEGDNA
ncbi:MAG: hypothetical protein GWN86_06965 [Desulfobacterales bacterium]|nr:hypothetical protein [Desulfobacterales bacterium]